MRLNTFYRVVRSRCRFEVLNPWTNRFLSTLLPGAGTEDPAAYCKDFVQKHDYESFLVSQFWPRGKLQNGYLALKAFAIELATIQDVVSTPMIGQMRMQFWRDAIKGIYDDRPPRHPIALALYDTCSWANIQTYHLNRIIDARDMELHTPTHLTVSSFTDHAESTSSTLLYALLALLPLPTSFLSHLSHAASHLGIAQTVVTLLRALPYHASRGNLVIPAEITAKHGVMHEDVFRRGANANGISDAVYDFAVVANDHMTTARQVFAERGGLVPGGAIPVFLSGVPVSLFLERLECLNFDVFDRRLQRRDWRVAWRVWKGFYQNKF